MRRMQTPILFKSYRNTPEGFTLGDVIEDMTKIKPGTKIKEGTPDWENWNVYQLNFDSYDDSRSYEGSSIIYVKEDFALNFTMIIKEMSDTGLKGTQVHPDTKITDISEDLVDFGFRVTLQLIAVNQYAQHDQSN